MTKMFSMAAPTEETQDYQISDHPVIKKFNKTNAKKIAFLIVSAFIVYHGILHLSYGIDSCKWLLSDGRFQGYRVWQPYGCMLHTYTKVDTRMCLRYIAYWGGHNRIVFLGDSRIRQLYHGFVQMVNLKQEQAMSGLTDSPIHHNLEYSEHDLRLDIQFLWHPIVNRSMIDRFKQWNDVDRSERPNIVVAGSATWSIKSSNASLKALEYYHKNLTLLMPFMDRLKETTQILWALQDPVTPQKLNKDRVVITNEQIDLYNKAAMEVFRYASANVHVWSSARLVSQGYASDDQPNDGLHMGPVALNYAIQILLNMYCNDQMNYNDGTCCSDPEVITTIQIITFFIFSIFLVAALIMILHRKFFPYNYRWRLIVNEEDPEEKPIQTPMNVRSYYELTVALAKFALILAYFYLSDRTNFFMKENKYYTQPNFFFPLVYVFALGLFFTEKSSNTLVLNRDQTDEWKGWMQLAILTYHMTGASQVLPIYMHIRLLVTAYLFLSGFGHFTYFWHTGDVGFHRLWKVIFRMNFLVIGLCLTMNRPYQFYYFVPLVSFWYLIIYTTMRAIPRITSSSAELNSIQYLYMVIKFVVLFCIITILYMSEVFFEKIFLTRPWKALFVTTDDSIKEWWFRWKIDRYSVPLGMLFSFGYHLSKQYHILDDHNHGYLFSKGFGIFATFSSLCGILIYTTFTFLCRNKSECNEIHPYISFIPIVSFIVLRNTSGLLRSRYSAFFAWFGRISLELFVCQYHIWLSADTHGVLVLVPSYPVLNVIITSFIFICISHEIHELTSRLVNYVIPNDWRYATRNLAVFILILIPIGVNDGMF